MAAPPTNQARPSHVRAVPDLPRTPHLAIAAPYPATERVFSLTRPSATPRLENASQTPFWPSKHCERLFTLDIERQSVLDGLTVYAEDIGLCVLVDALGRVELVERPRWLKVVR